MNSPAKRTAAHVIVLGNEKGGSGKSTMAVHIIVALLKAGRTVASIDTDSRQLSLTRYLQNRARWARRADIELELPTHFAVNPGNGESMAEVADDEHDAFVEIVTRLSDEVEFVVIDTPANDSYRMQLAHAMADTLVTPINDSFVDLDVLGQVKADDFSIQGISQYAELVRTARNRRHLADEGSVDWIIVRNRLAMLANRNQAAVSIGLKKLAEVLEFRVANGVSDRVVFRELFPTGLTAFDRFDRKTLGIQPTLSHVAARREIADLVAELRLPGFEPVVSEAGDEMPVPMSAA